ncbi:sigma-54 interaction domain-containing protein [Candidatus Methylomicrobium oryzae]|jgi:formate hydrogenlyase transcriptional activator|uniref:sigma-54 interaction domain-containing protein n=1 Tax=Candidatus Methylomicrobium oryzae TaxID=2802053 RepID=UPI0019217C0C|nr:sigma 54-interacting transcriptional regulator [Methylomicrobium sp. RS1]MBL1264085.1 sigma 54-interacting transcriptional regulator [Methylomicrobium sp. RS1]
MPSFRDSDGFPAEYAAPVDSSDLKILRALVEGAAQATGEDFFRALVKNLSLATGFANAFVAEFADSKSRVRTKAFWMNGEFAQDQEWDLAGTPCEEVLRGDFCHYPAEVWKRFPKEAGVESYLGVPLTDSDGGVLGHLALFDGREMPGEPRLLFIFRIFAARAAAELNRLKVVEQLRLSEERFRDLFDEAPIAYVHEDLESRFISANRAAMRILGITEDEVPGTVGMSFIPDTPEAQKRVKEAFASIERGVDTSGVVLELRRRDNGKPIWIQWWSKPDPGGQYTRTMFVDITEKVLMEQEQARLREQNLYLQEEIKAVHNFEEIVGAGPALTAVLNNVRRVAATDASVLIQGESGTGKELIARAIHSAGKRRDKPLIKVNCAALPSGLVESELFGHEKGAFTGAIAKRIGRFELADGGTLFLDEIGEIPLDIQVKLLRVLQEREFDRVGGKTPIKVDVRVIAATNRNLLQAVADKTFRDDLYYRLNVFPILMPPLRERSEDIPLLVSYLIGKFSKKLDKRVDGVGSKTLRLLQSYHWPGNIRELENVIERAIILSDEAVLGIDAGLLPGAAEPTLQSKHTGDDSLEAVEREHIAAMLEKTQWVIEGERGAAQLLGMNPSTLRYRIKKLGLLKPSR